MGWSRAAAATGCPAPRGRLARVAPPDGRTAGGWSARSWRRTSPIALIDEATRRPRWRELGAQVSADYADREVTLVSVLKGSLPFMADLMRAISIPVRIDLMEVSSYGGATTRRPGWCAS